MGKRLYAAYGSNLNLRQMKYRCPTAKLVGTGVAEGYELQFKGRPCSAFATIAPKEGASVPVAVWELKPEDERALDRYEGYPSHYFKQEIPVQIGGREISVTAYIMNPKMEFHLPTPSYLETVRQGYRDCGLDEDVLDRALAHSAGECCLAAARQEQEALFEFGEEDAWEEEPEESNPLCFSEGPKL